MSKVMKQIPFGWLMDRALTEFVSSGSVFGVGDPYRKNGGGRPDIFGEKPELPFGPAAGPHTQLAQNIIAGYVAGARFFELKTVQTLDGEDLPVSKPCITAPDECYNVEWSTELYVMQAMDEYIKGWFALKLLSREFGFGAEDGFVFNMSVGYDLEGIKSKKIDDFIEGLKNAAHTEAWQTCKRWATDNLARFNHVDEVYINRISAEICRSITLSTLHGCPPEEIERIASYLLSIKKLHTFVKCNPTLLGYEYARKTLDSLGFDYIAFDDHHFKADLQFSDAVPMFQRLQKLADSLSLSFGVKLTNTFPVSITGNELPGEEMYMSGRALFPLTIEVANRLSGAFGGGLRISYSGGADARNIGKLIDAGIWPVTLATTLLKPGGYKRLRQIAEITAACEAKPFSGVDCGKLQTLAGESASDPMYRKPAGIPPEHKMSANVPLLDCFAAPCRDGCPIGQDVPAYLRLAGEGKYLEALRVITERNPLPFITGSICSQFCAGKCTRDFYEGPVCIRAVKLEAAMSGFEPLLREIRTSPKSGEKVAVAGGGPAGLSVAYFLARAGRRVTLFEKKGSLGGVVRHVIPEFRIGGGAIDKDIELVKAAGVEIRLNHEVGSQGEGRRAKGEGDKGCERCEQGSGEARTISLESLRAEGYEQIVIAVGAWKPGTLDLAGGDSIDALTFLEQLKQSGEGQEQDLPPYGENVVVVGGGNTAMDAARAAKRLKTVKNVSLVYRRTKRYMPADAEEFDLAMEEGVEFRELLSPLRWQRGEDAVQPLGDNALICRRMELGAPDASGRRGFKATGETVAIPADTVISAIGSKVDAEWLKEIGVPADINGEPVVNGDTCETGLPGVYVIGDAQRGPATVVEAIADAMRCAAAITGMNTELYAGLNINPDTAPAYNKKGVLYRDCTTVHDSKRCLECATLCLNCVDVCPNRANIAVQSEGRTQIIHVDYMCNECGNCGTFCPYSSAPYKDKFTLFANAGDFEGSENPGFALQEDGTVRVRINGGAASHRDGQQLPEGIWPLIKAALEAQLHLGAVDK